MKKERPLYTSLDQLPLSLNADDIAEVLNISRGNAYTLMHREDFPTIHIGKRMVVPRARFIQWMKNQLPEQSGSDDLADITYSRSGDYLFPNLSLEEEPSIIGRYGLLRKSYLKDHKPGCNERVELITNQLAKREGVTEALKAKNQMEWVRQMNGIRARAEEVILSELIYC